MADRKSFVQPHVAQLEVRRFGSSAARGVEQFQQGAVAPPPGVALARSGEQFFHAGGRKDVRHALPQLLAAQQFGGTVAQHAFQLQITAKQFQRDDVPGDRRRGQVAAVQPAGVVGQVANRQAGDRSARQPLEEMIDVAAIGGDGVFGQMAFVAQMLDEGVAPTSAAGPAGNRHRLQGSARRHVTLPRRWVAEPGQSAGRRGRGRAHARPRLSSFRAAGLADLTASLPKTLPRRMLMPLLAASGRTDRASRHNPPAALRRPETRGPIVRILVTGGAGYVGSHAARLLIGRRPRGLDLRQPVAGPPRSLSGRSPDRGGVARSGVARSRCCARGESTR